MGTWIRHESKSSRFWDHKSNRCRIQTGSTLHPGLKTNTRTINKQYIINEHWRSWIKIPRLEKTFCPRNRLELFDCPLHHLLNNLPSRLDILKAVAIPWVSVLHPQSAERIQKDLNKVSSKWCYSQIERYFPSAQGTVMAPAHCPERNTPRSRVSFRESLGDHTVRIVKGPDI